VAVSAVWAAGAEPGLQPARRGQPPSPTTTSTKAAAPSPPVSSPDANAPALVARGLACMRGDELIFDGLSLRAGPGEIWQIVGANGAGKTSLLKILAGLAPAAGGELRWRDQEVQVGSEALRADLCYLGHLPGVTGFLSVAENLVYMLALGAGRPALGVAEAIDAVGLAGLADAAARRLSAGQRQRLALARFVALDCPLWIMDEPLTALDAAGRALVEGLLVGHARRGGVAIVSTHHPLDVPAQHLRRFEFDARPAP
jgi:heme exporter protein A